MRTINAEYIFCQSCHMNIKKLTPYSIMNVKLAAQVLLSQKNFGNIATSQRFCTAKICLLMYNFLTLDQKLYSVT